MISLDIEGATCIMEWNEYVLVHKTTSFGDDNDTILLPSYQSKHLKKSSIMAKKGTFQ